MVKQVVILGAGHAGGRAACALRKKGFEGRILLVGDESDPPYERPPLSKEALTEGADPLVNRIQDEDAYAAQDIELLLGTRAESLDLDARRVSLSNGGAPLSYDALILATGCRARQLPLEGAHHDRVLTLRSAADCRRLRPLLREGARVVLIGGGFIGLEVASSAAKLGCQVTVLEAAPLLLGRVLTPQVAGFLATAHRAAGVDIVIGADISEIRHGSEESEVRLADGRGFPADAIIVGVGASLNSELAEQAGLACQDGVLVDSTCRTAAGGVYAIGDIAMHENRHLGRSLRLESWENAELQADIAAANLVGETVDCDSVPWFWTDQQGINLQLLGTGESWEQEVLRGRPDDGAFCAFYLRKGRIVMAALTNSGRERRPVKQLMEADAAVPPEELQDADSRLRDIAKRFAST